MSENVQVYPGPQAKAFPAQDVEERGERGHGRGEQHPEPNGLDVTMMHWKQLWKYGILPSGYD